MRSYPRNSTKAAARIVALAMLADGHLDRSELAVLDRSIVPTELRIEPHEWDEVVAGLCTDLAASGELCWQSACRLGLQSIDAMLAEIDDPEVCLKVLRVCAALLDTDAQVSDGETAVVAALIARWRELDHPRASPRRACAAPATPDR